MNHASSSRFLIGLLLGTLAVLAFMFKPYVAVFVITLVFGVAFQPLNQILRKYFGKTGAALLTLILIVLVIAGPVSFVVAQVAKEAGHVVSSLQTGSVNPDTILTVLQAKMSSLFPGANIDVVAWSRSVLSWFLGQTQSIFQSITSVILTIFLSMVALYFWFKDSEKLNAEFLRIIPFSKEDASGILARLSLSVRSLIRGTAVIAILQGIVSGIGFIIFGIPNPFLWATVTAVCALVPMLGTAVIIIPLIAYLFLSGNMVAAFGLTLWGLCAVGLIDNLLGPKIISRGTNMHTFFTLISILGGVHLFGPIGIFAGPIVLSLFVAVSEVYVAHRDSDHPES